jgi:hypothetical protein
MTEDEHRSGRETNEQHPTATDQQRHDQPPQETSQRRAQGGQRGQQQRPQQQRGQKQPRQQGDTSRRQLLKYGGAGAVALLGGWAVFGRDQNSSTGGEGPVAGGTALIDKVVEQNETPLFVQLAEGTHTWVEVRLQESTEAIVEVSTMAGEKMVNMDTRTGAIRSFTAPTTGQYSVNLVSDGPTKIVVSIT